MKQHGIALAGWRLGAASLALALALAATWAPGADSEEKDLSLSRSSTTSSRRTTTQSNTSQSTSKTPARPAAQQQPANVTTKSGGSSAAGGAPRASRGQGSVISRGASRSKGKSSGLSVVEMKVDHTLATLYVDPPDQTAPEGGEIVTGFTLSNPKAQGFNRLRLAIRYDRDVVRPAGVRDLAIRRYLAQPSKVEVRPREGLVIITADLAVPLATVSETLLDLRWEALRTVRAAEFKFVEADGQPSGLWMKPKDAAGKETDILGDSMTPNDGFIHGTVQIVPPAIFEALQRNRARAKPGQAAEEEEELTLDEVKGGLGGVALRLTGPANPPRVGEEFDVDLVFDNRADSLVDGVEVVLGFDPAIFEVVDTDLDNWITRGVNILDGPNRDRFPFDYHLVNQAFNSRGEIVYKMGIGDAEKLRRREGVMATIRLRAKAPSPGAALRFLPPASKSSPGTRVTYMGKNALGAPERGVAGAEDLRLKVIN